MSIAVTFGGKLAMHFVAQNVCQVTVFATFLHPPQMPHILGATLPRLAARKDL
jgi:hypothetical protein